MNEPSFVEVENTRSEALFDPVLEAARQASDLAARLCPPACDWYHGIWPSLRVLGVAASPDRHSEFFLSSLAASAANGMNRVLVSGSADHSMVAHVLRAYRSIGAEPAVTVLDRCPTPAAVCRWYGDLAGSAVDTLVADFLDFPPDLPFDLICTHSFLSQFDVSRRPSLVAAWRDVLRPGGRLVTTTRITPGARDPQRFTDAEGDAFCERVRSEATRQQGSLALGVEELEAAARVYAERTVAHPTASVEDLRDLLDTAGFVIEELEVRPVAGKVIADNSGPGTGQPALYAEVVVRRG